MNFSVRDQALWAEAKRNKKKDKNKHRQTEKTIEMDEERKHEQ